MSIKEKTHFGINRKIISNMTVESWDNIPHCAITLECRMDKALEVLKEKKSNKKVTLNSLMLKVIVEGLKASPKMNGHISFNKRYVRGAITIYDNIDVSMPVILKNGEMLTLTVRNLENKNAYEIQEAVTKLVKKANNSNLEEAMYEIAYKDTMTKLNNGHLIKAINRLIGSKTGAHKVRHLKGEEKKSYYAIPADKRLTADDLEQGTITITNLGSLYKEWAGECTLLEIIPPQLCAIAISGITYKLEADENKIVNLPKLTLTVALDHRALDFQEFVPFMKKVTSILSSKEEINKLF